MCLSLEKISWCLFFFLTSISWCLDCCILLNTLITEEVKEGSSTNRQPTQVVGLIELALTSYPRSATVNP